jgi:hypothetical protein
VLDAARTVGLREVVMRLAWSGLHLVATPPSFAGHALHQIRCKDSSVSVACVHETGDRILLQRSIAGGSDVSVMGVMETGYRA